MHKFLKLSAVSVLAIIAASNAHAAGYTCEELIEYTSCNPGYYLTGGACPDGSVYGTGWCVTDGSYAEDGYSEEDCRMSGGDYLGTGCFTADGMELIDGEDVWRVDGNASLIPQTCNECPAGSTCAGGDAAAVACAAGTYQPNKKQTSCIDAPVGNYVAETGATSYTACAMGSYQPTAGQESCLTCPAGSYCAGTGLSAVSGECNIGTYSTGGATSALCTSCPETSLTDKDGDPVSATTSSTGSTSASACHIGDDVEFQDNKGIWHYKQNCEYSDSFSPIITISSEEECNALAAERPGYEWTWDTILYADGEDYGMGCVQYMGEYERFDFAPQTEYECNQIKNAQWSAKDGFCYCDVGYWVLTPTVLHCTDVI